MKLAGVSYRIVLGAFVALGTYGAAAYALLLLGQPASEWIVIVAAIVAVLVATKRQISQPTGDPCPRWLAWSSTLVLLSVTVALVIGVLATPARHWDGVVAWELKAFWLSVEPTIEQPFFRDAGVFSHSRDYPLLQPLLMAAGNRLLGPGSGRLLLPLLYLLLVATVGTALRHSQRGGALPWLVALAVGTTPTLITPSNGGADSGYAELFLTTCVAASAAGLLLKDRTLMFLGIFTAVLVKPEGLVYGAVAIPVLWCRSETQLLRTATAGWLLGAALWLPLQNDLYHLGNSSAHVIVWTALGAIGTLIVGSDVLLRTRVGARARIWITAAAFPALLLALPLVVAGTSGSGTSIGTYLQGFDQLLERVEQTGHVVSGFARYAFLRMGFALTFWVPLLAAMAFALKKVRLPEPSLWIFTALGLLSVLGPFLLSPEADMEHHIRSSMSRLQLHWVGAAWILAGVWVAELRGLPPTGRSRVG